MVWCGVISDIVQSGAVWWDQVSDVVSCGVPWRVVVSCGEP